MDKYLGKLVKITWRDAHHMLNDWVSEIDLQFPDTEIASVGLMVKLDEHHLMIAQSYCKDMTVANTFVITKAQVINIKELK